MFNDMTKKMGLCLNVHIYMALMRGLCNLGKVDKALKLKMEMECKGMRPNTITYTTRLSMVYSS